VDRRYDREERDKGTGKNGRSRQETESGGVDTV
jgi:hypothetical protein